MELNAKEQKTLFGLVVNSLPAPVRGSIFGDEAVCQKFGIAPEFCIPLDAETGVETKSLHNALCAAVSGRKSAMLKLRDGRRVRAKIGVRKGGLATLQLKKKAFAFPDADLLSPDKKTRLRALKRVCAARPLATDEEDHWAALATNRVFTNREYVDLMTGLEATPEAVHDRVARPQTLDSEKLVPALPEYYTRLVGRLGNSTSLAAYIADELAAVRTALFEAHPEQALRRVGYSALWQPLIPFDLLATINLSDVAPLLKAEDPFSLLCGFELCCKCLKKNWAVVRLGSSLLKKLLLDDRTSRARCNLFSACAIISMTHVRIAAKAASAPTYWTRLA